MKKYKLILVQADENMTGEYDNIVTSISEARTRAAEMIDAAGGNTYYPDTHVACYAYNEDTKYPYCDYRIFKPTVDGETCEGWMRVRDGIRIRMEYSPL